MRSFASFGGVAASRSDALPHSDLDPRMASDRSRVRVVARTPPQSAKRVQLVRGSRIGTRRYWLERIRYFVYYKDVGNGVIEISSLWHASRGNRP